MPFQTRFDLDLPEAIRGQLIDVFQRLDTVALRRARPKHGAVAGSADLVDVTGDPGVYGLFLGDTIVYAGKAGNLATRVSKHREKISGRKKITLEDVTFKAVSIHPNWRPYAPEGLVIDYYRRLGQCEWNGSGFGSNDPGRNRERTNKPPQGFDRQYEIRLDWSCERLQAGQYQVLDLLIELKKTLPYVFRFQSKEPKAWRKGDPQYQGKTVDLPTSGMTPVEILSLVVDELPGWQATAFPSHVILYGEKHDYLHGKVFARNLSRRRNL